MTKEIKEQPSASSIPPKRDQVDLQSVRASYNYASTPSLRNVVRSPGWVAWGSLGNAELGQRHGTDKVRH